MKRMHAALGFALSAVLAWGQAAAAPRAGDATRAVGASTKAKATASPYRFAPVPAWVKDPGETTTPRRPGSAGPLARRELLLDQQVLIEAQGPTEYLRTRRQALDTAGLKDISEPTIAFNPAFQQLVIHRIAVQRGAQTLDRTRDTRIEVLRREHQLEQSMIDGQNTALLMLRDVRVGDIVDVAYSIVGDNPIFGGRHASGHMLASDAPIERVHLRIDAPASRKLQWRTLPQQLPVQHNVQGDRQLITLSMDHMPAVQMETAVPPWVKVWPALQVTEYASWDEVERWAEGLFKTPPASGEVTQRIEAWKARNLPREQLLAEVLRFVQDEIRYFSTSLGESSHRPAPPARTLADRKGDCKDKTVLLNTLLGGLGFDVKPALVSTLRQRGIQQFLPSHDLFDHVVTAVDLDGQLILLDGTLSGQGLGWRERGFMDLGLALVVGRKAGLEAIKPPPFAVSQIQYQQTWDLSQPGQPTHLTVTMMAKGLVAERWRQALGTNSLDQVTQSIAGAHVRATPGLRQLGQTAVLDDRERNVLTLTLHFEHPSFGTYRIGGLDTEYLAGDMLDHLIAPMEPKRQHPFWVTQSEPAEMRIVVRSPRPFGGNLPPPQVVQDRHFSFSSRMEAQGQHVTLLQRYERKLDEVQPAQITAYREAIIRARQLTGQRLRVLLVDRNDLNAAADRADREHSSFGDRRNDELNRMLQRELFDRQAATETLKAVPANSELARRILVERGQANNHLGASELAIADANLVLKSAPQDAGALSVRGVALIGLKQPVDARQTFQSLRDLQPEHEALQEALGWLGITQLLTGDPAGATRTLSDHAQNTAGEAQTFALAWLYLAAERQGRGQGTEVISPHMSMQDRSRWPGILPHYLQGQASQDELMRAAKADPEQARLRLAEAHFFVGQKHLLQGDTQAARQSFRRVVDIRALPYREHNLAELELQRIEGR